MEQITYALEALRANISFSMYFFILNLWGQAMFWIEAPLFTGFGQ